MNWARCTVAGLAFAGLFGPAGGVSRAQNLEWREFPGGRSAALTVPAVGKTGFKLLDPSATGLTFTNSLDEGASAANRVLLNGAGVATGDFDHDGWPDIFFCSLNGRNTLYRNLGGWKFTDVTESAGLKRDSRYYRGAVFADVNGDGSLDLLVGIVGGGVECFLNDGRGRFADATEAARTRSPFATSTLALADVDGNGTLDLYVANNRTDDMRDRGQVNLQMINGQMAVPPALQDRLVVTNGQVLEYGEPDQLYLNDGKGRFTAISWTGGRFRNEEGAPLERPPLDWGLTATFRDINADGFPDLYVCNDFWTPDRLWLNDGKGRFRAAPRLALRNMSASSMGVDFADIDRDGRLDFFVVDMLSRDPRLRKRQKLAQPPMASPLGAIDNRPEFMRNTLFVGRGDGTFAEAANFAGVAASEWSWSPVFLDVDLDGYEDLLITTGHAWDVQDLDAAAKIRALQHSWKGFTNEAERQKAFTKELMEHMRLYPRLETPVVAFRNRGDLQFEEVTSTWGTDQPGIHHAIALADFDRDGDLDLVVNNLGSAAGLYRNEIAAGRVAVRLRGLPPNTQGIGAKVKLLAGAVPAQGQEVISGGRYMAGSEPALMFAAGKAAAGMTIEVKWRNGGLSRVADVGANRIYEIHEPATGAGNPREETPPPDGRPALFEDVSRQLQHVHHEEPFDDFARQPLLFRRLSQLGPSVSWFDVDGDGAEDLIVGSGKGGRMACYRNDKRGGFQLMTGPPVNSVMPRDQTAVLGWITSKGGARLLGGSASYEDGQTNAPDVLQFDFVGKATDGIVAGGPASCGPLALGDVDGDGDLDLFVGGRAVPGRYPEPASSRLYRFDGTRFQLDSINRQALEGIGLVSGAVWSDLDGDGLPELLLACEWGPLRIFRNDKGKLTAWNPPIDFPANVSAPSKPETRNTKHETLNDLTGWLNGVATGDFDGDGRMDIVASNWGLNSEYSASMERPLQCFYGDLLDRGTVDELETEWDSTSRTVTPRRRLDVLGRSLPMLMERYTSHRQFSEASLTEVLGPLAAKARKAEVTTLASMVFLNRGDHFEGVLLPRAAQMAPAFGLVVADFDGDGNEDLFLSQNFFATTAEVPRLDAGRGLLLRGDGAGTFAAVSAQESGIEVYGEQRGAAAADYDADGRVDLVVTQNGAATKLFHNLTAKPGLRVRLKGPPDNPTGVGAVVRLKNGARLGPAREIHAGSGYWSQDGAVQVVSSREPAVELWVRWPGGIAETVPVPRDAQEITVRTNASNQTR
jgi:hypothetical protein